MASTKSSCRKTVNSPWSEKSVSVVKRVADLIGFSPRFFRQRQHRRQRRARDAVADGVDLLLAGDLAGDAHRLEVALLDILLQPDIGIARVGVLPADHEQRVALVHDPADQAVLRLQVHDVELVDPWREDHQGVRCTVSVVGAYWISSIMRLR
jgi:hypothetical protein